jgi:hypothetical protein
MCVSGLEENTRDNSRDSLIKCCITTSLIPGMNSKKSVNSDLEEMDFEYEVLRVSYLVYFVHVFFVMNALRMIYDKNSCK